MLSAVASVLLIVSLGLSIMGVVTDHWKETDHIHMGTALV